MALGSSAIQVSTTILVTSAREDMSKVILVLIQDREMRKTRLLSLSIGPLSNPSDLKEIEGLWRLLMVRQGGSWWLNGPPCSQSRLFFISNPSLRVTSWRLPTSTNSSIKRVTSSRIVFTPKLASIKPNCQKIRILTTRKWRAIPMKCAVSTTKLAPRMLRTLKGRWDLSRIPRAWSVLGGATCLRVWVIITLAF